MARRTALGDTASPGGSGGVSSFLVAAEVNAVWATAFTASNVRDALAAGLPPVPPP